MSHLEILFSIFLGSVNDFFPEIFALVPTINLHSLRSDSAHLLFGTRTARVFSLPDYFFSLSSFSGNTIVSSPGQNLSASI